MRGALLLVVLAGCPDKPRPQPSKSAIRIAIPPGAKVAVSKECSLWAHPPRTEWYQDVATYDLDARTFEAVHRECHDTSAGQPPPGADLQPKERKQTGAIDAARAELVRTRLAAVLAGSAWEPVYPMSGGGGCTLVLHGGDVAKPYVKIDRAEPHGDDAVDQLLAIL